MTEQERIASVKTNVAYMFVDLLESALMDMDQALKEMGTSLVHEEKRNFNIAIKAIRKLKKTVGKIPLEQQEDYGNNADELYQLILLVIDRCGPDSVPIKKLAYSLIGLKSQAGLEPDMSVYD